MFQALKSFCGKVSMKKGETKEINDENVSKDLINAGLIKEIKQEVINIENKVKTEFEKIEEKIDKEVKKTRNSRKKK